MDYCPASCVERSFSRTTGNISRVRRRNAPCRESLLVPLGMRIRDVRQGRDEFLYVVVDHDRNGGILRIESSATHQTPTSYSARPPR
jgi:glucose/arabinose dehydrogenase